jgi:serine/threonine protein kinase/Tol biopolymer transport system component
MADRARIGSYEVLGPLGSGGMGVVHRARDTRLGRDVAIKVLPEDVAADPDRIARLEREARLLAALNHPSIATIYGLESLDGRPALVLELVEGETLGERIARGRLPVEKALPIALQIADALEAAHDKGIVHRDLKPANVKFASDGRVKVLDFGLAKMVTPTDDTARADASTIMSTAAGRPLIAGTPAYMSPEQARGEASDGRTDTWAFGCVLYEMLTGRPAFGGRTVSDTIGDVLRSEPAWNELPPNTPLPVTLLLRRCLSKELRRRQQFIADARVEIEQLLSDPALVRSPVERQRHVSPIALWSGAALACAALILAGIPAMRFLLTRTAPAHETIFEVSTPTAGSIAISADGRSVAYLAPAIAGAPPSLWVRRLDTLDGHPLPGTENAGHFSWSPDGGSILFASVTAGLENAKLKRIDVARAVVQTLADHGPYRGSAPAVNDSGVVLFLGADRQLHAIASSGGESSVAIGLDPVRHEIAQQWPSFLPDGRHFLYLSSMQGSAGVKRAIAIGSLDSKTSTPLMDAESLARYASPGYVLYVNSERTLMARPFDSSRLRWTGDAQPLAEAVSTVPSSGLAAFDVSREGTLIYRAGGPRASLPLAWIDRAGDTVATVCPGAPASKAGWRLSPDDRQAVIELARRDLSLCNLDRAELKPLTRDGMGNRSPVWSPDGARIVFAASKNRTDVGTSLYEIPTTGSDRERVLLNADPRVNLIPLDWSRDGEQLVFSKQQASRAESSAAAPRDLWILPMTGARVPVPYLTTAFDEMQAAISPDGKWLAFASNEAGGEYDVYVRPFPVPTGENWRISTEGGCCPRWRKDGSELYILNQDRRVMAVHWTGGRVAPSAPQLFGATVPLVIGVGTLVEGTPYDAAADGRRFLVHPIPTDSNAAASITVVLNWTALRKR